jgi:hypothetical protein
MLEGIVLGEILRKLQDISKKLDTKIVTHYDLPKTTVASQRIEKENKKPDKEPYVQAIIHGKPNEHHHENWDRVKFPAFCLYGKDFKYAGIIHRTWSKGYLSAIYELFDVTNQHEYDRQTIAMSLQELYEKLPFSIEKAKIIIKRG